MKRILYSIMIALVSVGATAQSLNVAPIEAQTGEETALVVNLTEGTSMTALQFNLSLPEGVTLTTSGDTYGTTLGTATDGHTLDVETLGNGDLLFILYNTEQKAFKSGELLRIPLTAGSTATEANGKLYTVRTATADAVSHTCADASFSVKVTAPEQEPDIVDLTKGMFHEWDGCTATSQVTQEDCGGALNLGTNLPSGSLVYGDASVRYTHYADLTGYNTLLITGTPGMQLRVLINRLEVGNGGGDANGGAYTELNPTIGTDGTVAVDLSGYEFVHLNSIKTGWNSPEGIIESLTVSKEKMEQPDAIGDIKADATASVKKVIRKNRVVIIKNGKEYNPDGTQLK